jgi:hypothetical protein
MNHVDKLATLYARANCRLANPSLFDSKSPELAVRALDYCLDCSVTALCREIVLAPYEDGRTYYDGVAGGRVWSMGRDVTRSALERADEVAQKDADEVAGIIPTKSVRPYKPLRWMSVEYAVRGLPHSLLTSAEKVAACLVAWDMGLTSQETAHRLGMTPKTVRQYRCDAPARLSAHDLRSVCLLTERMDAEDQAA